MLSIRVSERDQERERERERERESVTPHALFLHFKKKVSSMVRLADDCNVWEEEEEEECK